MGKKADFSAVEVVRSADITVKNRVRRAVVFNLPCASYCKDGPCSCAVVEKVVEEYNHRNQEAVRRLVERRICGSVTFLAGETKSVNRRVLNVPEIAAAVARGELVVS